MYVFFISELSSTFDFVSEMTYIVSSGTLNSTQLYNSTRQHLKPFTRKKFAHLAALREQSNLQRG